jgi:formate dehydrogenase major subunit
MDTVVRSRRWLLSRSLAGTALAGMAALGVDLRPAQARAVALRITETKQYPSVCPYCAVGCDTMIYAKDGEIIDIEGDRNSPINEGNLCPKGAAIYQLHVNPNRLTQVLHRKPGGTQWEVIALD